MYSPMWTQEEKESLARKVYTVHGPNKITAIKELRERLGCGLYEAKGLIDIAMGEIPSKVTGEILATTVEEKRSIIDTEWNAKAAEKWIRAQAAVLSREAKYYRENAKDCSSDEDEFRCWLSNGMGIDDEQEQNEIIAKIHGKDSGK
jgi:hypothetical protein